MSKSIKLRGFVTAVTLFVWVTINWILAGAAPIISADLAGKQFDNSNVSYGVSRFAEFFTGSGLPFVLLLVVLAAIWWKPLKSYLVSAVVLVLMMGAMQPAHAYYDKSDYAEVYFVLPNESAFFIPDVGANKDSQAKFGSEEYLKENKIAAKRFEIKHVKLENSGLFSNFYVPAGRLVIVDRTPYNREWVAATDRGTSAKDQSFPCQSNEGLDISVGIAVGTSLLEDNSPRYLYRFGIKSPEGDRKQPEVVFTSVLFSRSLQEAMDGVVRNNIQTLVCGEFSKRSFYEGNSQAAQIMEAVKTSVTTYLTSVGITLDFIGWADTFTFDPMVQKAINDAYIAATLTPVLPILQALADITVKEGLGAGLGRRLPNTLLMPPDMMSGLLGTSLLKPMKATGAPPQ